MNIRSFLLLIAISSCTLLDIHTSEDLLNKGSCKKLDCLTVRKNLTVGGNETVGGTICASGLNLCQAASVGTPGVPGIGGFLAWAEVSNDTIVTNTTITSTTPILINPSALVPLTYADQLQGITFNGTDTLTVNTAGIYMYQVYVSVDLQATVSLSLQVDPNVTGIQPSFQLVNGTTPYANSIFGFSWNPLLQIEPPVYGAPGIGAGLLSLQAGDSVSIMNVSQVVEAPSPQTIIRAPAAVFLGVSPQNGQPVNLVKLRLVRIA